MSALFKVANDLLGGVCFVDGADRNCGEIFGIGDVKENWRYIVQNWIDRHYVYILTVACDPSVTPVESRPEMVNHPSHYNSCKYECIDVAEELGFMEDGYVFSAFRYIWRHHLKGKPKQDLKKAIWYLTRKLESMPDDPE